MTATPATRNTAPFDRTRSDGAQQPPEELELPGRLLLASGVEMPCTARIRSPLRGEIVAPQADVAADDMVICALAHLGILVGTVKEPRSDGFTVAFAMKEAHRDRIAAQLEWRLASADRAWRLRSAPRIVPLCRAVEVRLAETIALAGTIVDISMSGAAIALSANPGLFVGGRVRVGTRLATVVRAIPDGIAVQFTEPFPPETFDVHVRP